MNVRHILAQAKGLVLTAGTKGSQAKDKNGYAVAATDESACTFCSVGAVGKVTGDDHGFHTEVTEGRRALGLLLKAALEVWTPDAEKDDKFTQKTSGMYVGPAYINDSRPELLTAMWDRAIELAQAEDASCPVEVK